MTELSDLAHRVAAGDVPVDALHANPGALMSPESAIRQLHLELPNVGVASPFGAAHERLNRVDKVMVQAQALDYESGRRRRELVEQLAAGNTDLADAVKRLDIRTVGIDPNQPGLAAQLTTEARTAARNALAGELGAQAGPVFDQLAEAAAEVVATLEALPEPPRGLWILPDPTTLLARAESHELTLSTVAAATEKFWKVQRLADMVRNQAGYGPERLTSGAPRAALVYRNWKKTIDGDRELRQTRASMQLWRTVVDDWQPGVWRPDQIDVPVEDRSFGARLRNLGRAVG